MMSFAVSLFFALNAWAAEVDVQANVDRNKVGQGDVINLIVSVSSASSINVNEPRLPAMPGFELINSSTSQQTSSSYVNGQFTTQQTRNFIYLLAVDRKGKLTIPSIPVNVDGQVVSTKPIEIDATGARSAPNVAQPGGGGGGGGRGQGQPQDPFAEMDEMEELFNQMLQRRLMPRGGGGVPGRGGPALEENLNINPNEAFFIKAETDKTKAYVGEQITASFYIYTPGNVRDIDTLKYPDLKGFWKEEIEMATRLNFEAVNVNGRPYQRALLVSYALFPIKAGKATVDSYKAKCTVISPGNMGFGRPYEFTKVSKPITIDVLDVPTANKPQNFTGAVGVFRLKAEFEPPTGTTNQPVTLRLRLEGQGNAKLIELPNLNLPPTFEIYDQKSQAKFLKDGTSFKEFEVMILPREPGVFQIPPVSISAFYPEKGEFMNVASQPLSLTVTGSASAPGTPAAPAKGEAPKSEPRGPRLPGIASDLDAGRAGGQLMNILSALALLAAFGWLMYQAKTNLRRKPKKQSLQIMVKRRMKSIRELADKGEWRRFGVEMTNAVYFILGQVSEQGGAHQELSRLLEHTPPSLRNELAEPIRKLLDQCEALSFAPESLVGDMAGKDKLGKLLGDFEKVMNRAIELAEI